MLASIVIVTSFFDNTAVTPASDYFLILLLSIVFTSLHARVGNYYAFVAANSTIGVNPSNLNQQHPAII